MWDAYAPKWSLGTGRISFTAPTTRLTSSMPGFAAPQARGSVVLCRDGSTVQPAPLALRAYLRIAPAAGSIEVGHINFSPLLQRTPAATEAMYLMMRHAFALGYRRYEWKCDALNAPSRAAAERLGLTFEGIFRQATVYKGRNRDSAWYAAIDKEWPVLGPRSRSGWRPTTSTGVAANASAYRISRGRHSVSYKLQVTVQS